MTWTDPPQLARFALVLERARTDASSISDDDMLAQVRATYWGTNCWCWVEMSLAIISAVCALRPHLAQELIGDPIDVMIQGGLDDENEVIAQGVALAGKDSPYVPLLEDGRAWLLQDWPQLEDEAKAIFRRKRVELTQDG